MKKLSYEFYFSFYFNRMYGAEVKVFSFFANSLITKLMKSLVVLLHMVIVLPRMVIVFPHMIIHTYCSKSICVMKLNLWY